MIGDPTKSGNSAARVGLDLAIGLPSWISTAMNHLKEWAGLGSLACVMLFVSFLFLWCLCKMRVSRQRNMALLAQAFVAIEDGHSPQAWLSIMQKS